MPFDNSKNQARARNMAELLRHVETSAAANKASPEEVAAVLAPALEVLARLGLPLGASEAPQGAAEEPGPAPAAMGGMDLKAGQLAALKLADQASLRELICSLIGRLEAHAAQTGGNAQ